MIVTLKMIRSPNMKCTTIFSLNFFRMQKGKRASLSNQPKILEIISIKTVRGLAILKFIKFMINPSEGKKNLFQMAIYINIYLASES